MKIVIQCAASKDPSAGYFGTERRPHGRLNFVADPLSAPRDQLCMYARPDDPATARGRSWRDELNEYNKSRANENPYGLFPAYRLYANRAYVDLVQEFGPTDVYILSAGWGLIRSDFLVPQYDITFSASAEPYKRRRKKDRYADFRHLPGDCEDRVVFFGGKDYLLLFCDLTVGLRSERVVFFNSNVRPAARGCTLVRYPTTTRTNWHYACVRDFLAGKLAPVWEPTR